MYSEKLFSYGTLQLEVVQMSTFRRKLNGSPDILSGFELKMLDIKDDLVVSTSGHASHPIISFTGQPKDKVNGVVFDISLEELHQADAYEVSDYKRISVTLNSGIQAWVYVRK